MVTADVRLWPKARAKAMFRKADPGRKWDFSGGWLRAQLRIHTFGQNESVTVTFQFNEFNPACTTFRVRPILARRALVYAVAVMRH